MRQKSRISVGRLWFALEDQRRDVKALFSNYRLRVSMATLQQETIDEELLRYKRFP